jgi:hypothetical protein
MSILDYEDLTEMIVNYLNANDMGSVANSIQQEIKSKHRLTYRQVHKQKA